MTVNERVKRLLDDWPSIVRKHPSFELALRQCITEAIREAAACKHELVRWMAMPGCYYKLHCATCHHPFENETWMPSTFEIWRLNGSSRQIGVGGAG